MNETMLIIMLLIFPSQGSDPLPPFPVGTFTTVAQCESEGARVLAEMKARREQAGNRAKLNATVLCLKRSESAQ